MFETDGIRLSWGALGWGERSTLLFGGWVPPKRLLRGVGGGGVVKQLVHSDRFSKEFPLNI